MGRFRDSSLDDDAEQTIDISPLIDCIFILLIFFIVTTTFVEETGVEVDKPTAAMASNLEKNSILLAITAEGDVVHARENIGMKGVRARVERLLRAEQDDAIPVIIQVDQKAPSGLLVQVVGEAKAGGATQVNLSAKKQRN